MTAILSMTSRRLPSRLLWTAGAALGLALLPSLLAGDESRAPTAAPTRSPAELVQLLARASSRAEADLGRPGFEPYRGWIRYLRFVAGNAAARGGAASPASAEATARLDDWLRRIEADSSVLSSLRGPQEWAYESPVDDSGQPFRIDIPTDYDPARPAPLAVYMHGYSGNHIEHSTGMAPHPGYFEVSVLGRSRGGGYRALSEADVLQAVDYITRHWAIDPDRISLNGGSMGGGGTYRLGARYPQRWCSGRTTCGYASYLPLGNLVTLPIYATHSLDDPTVSFLHDSGPLERLREMGGQVIFDRTNGYGHAVWTYKEGNARGLAWERFQVRPDSRTVRRIDYTALDGGAVRGWWGEVAEWGPDPLPARFVLTAGDPNLLFADLTNIARLRLLLSESPFDLAKPLEVSVNGAVPFIVPAPLPESLVLAKGYPGWDAETQPPRLPFRLHTPGSALLLYDGEPLLIVYGTQGDAAARQAMRAAARAAAKSTMPSWPDDSGEASPDDKVPHSQNLYGPLNTKADTEVTAADMARCHLVLIGTAEQNSVVARIADWLPVKYEAAGVSCSDGTRFPGTHLALGLVYFNPLAKDRLVFWIASDDSATYAANSAIPAIMSGGMFHTANAFGADLVVMPAGLPTLVAARSFDSRWHWVPDREASPLLPAKIATPIDFRRALSEAIRRAAAADYALVSTYGPSDPPVTIGVTRICDIVPFFQDLPIGMFEATGSELRRIADQVAAKDSYLLIPGLDRAGISETRRYRVALPIDVLWFFSKAVQPPPADYWLTGLDTGEAVERFFPVD
jgi:hypothetical protein